MGGNPHIPAGWIKAAVDIHEGRTVVVNYTDRIEVHNPPDAGDFYTSPPSVLDAPLEGDVVSGYTLGGHGTTEHGAAYVAVMLGGELVRLRPDELARQSILSGPLMSVDESKLFPGVE